MKIKGKMIGKKILVGALVASMQFSSMTMVDQVNAYNIGKISIDPNIHYQTLEGWGTSLCWWGNVIGSWGDQDFNGNGRPDREEIAELAFSPEYLNLNIVRYNVGGGDKEDTSIKRIEGVVPGWSKDIYGVDDPAKDENGVTAKVADDFYTKSTEEMNDAGQLWMLEQANKYRKELANETGQENDVINKVFSNSPPYYMTKSGSSTGGYDWDKNNLKDVYYDDFAQYMALATKWVNQNLEKKFGVNVDYVEPLNEPDTNYWLNGSTKQEGCIFNTGELQSKAYREMQKALDNNDLDNVAITGTDETSLWSAINSFNRLDSDVKANLKTISAHTYSGNDSERNTLRKTAASYDKGLWMSEITRGGGAHNEGSHNSMSQVNAKDQSQGIMADLKYMQPTAWIAWLVADSEYECLNTNSNWGLIHTVFESNGPVKGFHNNLFNSDGSVKEGIPDEGYWAVTKQFYTMMQYSKYLKAGYTLVEIDDSNMVAAISPERDELVVVAQNFGNARDTSVDLGAFTNAKTAEVYRTSDDESCELVATQDVSKGILDIELPKDSVTTYVIKGNSNTALYQDLGHAKIIESDITTPSDASAVGVSDLNKFTYTGSWNGAKETQDGQATAQFKFDGDRAIIYGKKFVDGAIVDIRVDGKKVSTIDTNQETMIDDAILFDSGKLTNGTHTIELKLADNQIVDKATLSISKAKIITGDYVALQPRITTVAPHDQTLLIDYDGIDTNQSVTIKYGLNENSLDKSITAVNGSATLRDLENGKTYYLQVIDEDNNASKLVTGVPGIKNEDVYYFVNAGTNRVHSLDKDEQLGTSNSTLDQVYGKDSLTGKSWGYVDNPIFTNIGTNRFDTVRGDEQNIPGKGIEYKFELDPGEYTVTVGMLDPWSNGNRRQDVVIQGATVDEKLVPSKAIVNSYKGIVGENNTLSVQVIRSKDNSGANEDPLVSYILIEKYNPDVIDKVLSLNDGVTVSGVIPTLPSQVDVVTLGGQTVKKEVTWDINAKDFIDAKENTSLTITGSIEGTTKQATIKVNVLPKNTQYFIDCNNQNSTTYPIIDNSANLLNKVPDQKYDNSWGFIEDYGTMNNTNGDKYDTGWYAKANQSIIYKVPLKAGEYQASFGFEEWWGGNTSRAMKITADFNTIDGTKQIVIGEVTISAKGTRVIKTNNLSLDQDSEVTFTISKTGKDDPVLSFIQINRALDHSDLITRIEQARNIDRKLYTADSLMRLDQAVNDAIDQMLFARADEKTVANALTALDDAYNQLKLVKVNTQELENLIVEAKQVEAKRYTLLSYQALQSAILKAQEILKKDPLYQSDVDKVLSDLQTAIDGLEKLPVDFDGLKILLEQAKGIDASLYTDSSYELLVKAIKAGEIVFNDKDSLPAAVEYAKAEILEKIEALIKKPLVDPEQKPVIKPDDQVNVKPDKVTPAIKTGDSVSVFGLSMLVLGSLVLTIGLKKRKV